MNIGIYSICYVATSYQSIDDTMNTDTVFCRVSFLDGHYMPMYRDANGFWEIEESEREENTSAQLADELLRTPWPR
jgi:hypothetical protein